MHRGTPRRIVVAAVLALAGVPAVAEAAASAPGAEPAGSAEAGRALFSGARRARNGGAPCGSCHTIAGEGPAFAASFGPDLSRSFEGLAADAVDGLLQDPPFPTMVPIYAGHALTPAERADLAAYLMAAGGKGAPPGAARLAGWAGALALACLVGMSLLARRRKGSTRPQLAVRTRPAPALSSWATSRAAPPATLTPQPTPRTPTAGGGSR